ncbi:MAG: hypothetical protein A3F33_01740 [Candidatus Woykebacteria bacterium RIFCSPHIGHO2_12_FULL_43_10]|uniref:BioF2-like acetyltransferase domain-containing protein n=1 Tax=Candidatus Woykebacteria bacterium RIFCSPLOWO2_01_FULL_43_14 TaxID=1802605 RepID=A0A1G1WV54_9BACT|nr:MAG: hypothetical protein A2802_02400 [Candidatus Woykebacteria bacterium RIFCSPHIGHO2_01_FULL_43_29]OGY29534.1 MAG: hypothetical protein A3F33_01740 [Candidatus Woykebacteria bacterium RIFCSPHIGHO2_12_FULL_43_10]OGY31649.1 MAG: hypothetical protein A3A61_00470 [Candidatus Woykebacteria bacterium RIFCSPLOWO2_01_FULL_43_14]
MTVEVIESKEIWDSFVNKLQPHTFLQSWNWGQFNLNSGNKIWRLGLFENNTLLEVALIIKVEARRGSFLFCPHGPISTNTSPNSLSVLTDYLKNLGKSENVSFIRFSPLNILTEENQKLFKNLGFRDAPIHMHSELVWMLDVTPSEEELLANMRKTTRYSIRKAISEGVEVISCSNLSLIDDFYSIYLKTVGRHNFVPFSKEYIQKEFEAFSQGNQALFFFGKLGPEILSASMVIYTNGSGFYHHGASINSKVPVTYLSQWEAIKEAKRRGCRYYNFWGISPESNPNHPWAGLTMFKQGFGGFSEEYIHAQDMILSPKYWLTYGIEKLRKAQRGL